MALTMPISEEKLATLRGAVRGPIITPSDDGYDEARAVNNGMIDKRPALIARCTDAADVVTMLTFAREEGVDLAVRGGGHNGPGLGTVEGGVVIDLAGMKGVRVDPEASTARVAGGATLGDVDHALDAFGLAVPSGIVSTTGVGGITLGGGTGYLTRKFGLAIDSLLEADVVLADGRQVTASADEHPDLFWALRGGGGNFGVVTSFQFRAHSLGQLYAGPILWDADRSADVMRFWQDTIDNADDDLNGFFAFLKVPPAPPFPEELHLKPMCGIVWCYTGPQEKAEEVFKPIRAFGPPVLDMAGPMPLKVLNSLFDPLYPPGLQWYWKADFMGPLDDQVIARHLEYGLNLPTWMSTMHLYPMTGAAARVGNAETAFSYRDARYNMVMAGIDADPANNENNIAWARSYWDALHPFSTGGGAYVNFMMEEGEDRVRASYRGNYDRLVEVKRRYDPGNLFHVNQNIRP
jgi:FAD/FMN-containing dehydrogenase